MKIELEQEASREIEARSFEIIPRELDVYKITDCAYCN